MKTQKATIDGNTAATHVAYAFSEVAAIYPITPSSGMGEMADSWSAKGKKNIFGETVDVIELQSEGGASGAIHGALSAGALSTTFTASQGLLLMLPNMHKIAGEMLPTVFHVSSRSLACQSLSIFGDHSDVMAARNTGWALVSAASIQEIMDLGVVSHLATLKSRIPFLNFFEGFRLSHEIQKVEMIDYETMASMVEPEHIEAFRKLALNPDKPFLKVGAENPDVYFQGRETVNGYYLKTPGIVQEYMDLLAKKTGRRYHLFDYLGAPDATDVIVAMGSGSESVEEAVNYINQRGGRVGLVKVRLYRPFATDAFLKALPESVKRVAVLDRTKEPGAPGEPLYLDVSNALVDREVKIIGGRYGLSSKDFTPSMAKAVFDHLAGPAFHGFTVGINDDVTKTSVTIQEEIDTEPEDITRCIFWGLGSDGTVGANKNSIKIIGDNTDMNAQGYFSYDSKKSGGITISYLRFGKSPIKAPYLVQNADFIALHNPAYIGRYDVLREMNPGGTFLLNSEFSNEEVFSKLTREMQETIIKKKVKFYNINALKIAQEVGLGNRINTVMQAAFFKVSGILPEDEAIKLIKDMIKKTYSKKGKEIVDMNWKAVDRASDALKEIDYPKDVKEIRESVTPRKLIPDSASSFEKNVIEEIMHLRGDDIPVSQMPLDGAVPTGTTRLEKRGIAPQVPVWLPDHCTQCNQCVLVCPHAVIRAKQIEPEKLKDAPDQFVTLPSKTKNDRDLKFRLQVYIEDCTGCANCINICPAKEKALEFRPIEEEREKGQNRNVEFFEALPDNILDGTKLDTLKGSQFKTPLFEFSGACAGCGETPYVKLLTQLFGERLVIANATGCSSIYGGTFPTIPYCTTKDGRGPTWANSLFEDNAEYGFGMRLAVNAQRKQLKRNIETLLNGKVSGELKNRLNRSLELWEETGEEAYQAGRQFKEALQKEIGQADSEILPVLKKTIELQDAVVDRSVWCVGGDGWAYDIGYGGLDHVLAQNKNVNILVLDTEVYSNTGGQASKATPLGSVAQFAASGKRTTKKDLGLMCMSYGYIYVASISLAANPNQAIRAFIEAESYPGPSIIIAYAPCIAHGTDMTRTFEAQKNAVRSGYWPLYRFNPTAPAPFNYESRDPKMDMIDFLMNENRYRSLKRQSPKIADQLFQQAREHNLKRHEHYKKLSEIYKNQN